MFARSFCRFCFVLATLTASQLRAQTLTGDVRAVSTSSGTVFDAKHVEYTGGGGGTVTFEVWSVITGYDPSNPNPDFLDYLHGSFLSANGGLLGDLRAQFAEEYGDFIASNGLRQDLDGDGDLDVGSNIDDSFANFFRAYSGMNAHCGRDLEWLQT